VTPWWRKPASCWPAPASIQPWHCRSSRTAPCRCRALQEQISPVRRLFKRDENVPASPADAALIRLAEITDAPLRLTIDSDFQIYRRHGRQTIPLPRLIDTAPAHQRRLQTLPLELLPSPVQQ
jgi:hypothetical protein